MGHKLGRREMNDFLIIFFFHSFFFILWSKKEIFFLEDIKQMLSPASLGNRLFAHGRATFCLGLFVHLAYYGCVS
jgi:hypothetical protein